MKKTPLVIATGFTSAYLGDERSLREFVVGDHVTKNIQREGENAVLYLINDSYDPLNERQLRVAVNKEEKLIKQFKKYCGQPIAEIPDPFGCHASYAEHFVDALVQRLRGLDIHPVVIDTYKAYKTGHYDDYIKTTFENYDQIQTVLAEKFDSYSMKNLFRVQCPNCACLDATHINKVSGDQVVFNCEGCATTHTQQVEELNGKLSWKVDCAARWNLYGVDKEIFSKAHIDELGSLAISSFISEQFFGGVAPEPIKYGAVNISQDMSYRLLEILPPQMFKKLFTEHITRDITLNRETVENYCRKYLIRPDMSYVDFINQELPLLAIRDVNLGNCVGGTCTPCSDIDLRSLIEFGNRYSGFYYHKEHSVSLADAEHIHNTDKATVKMAQNFILYSLSVRDSETDEDKVKFLITRYLQQHKEKSRVYPYLRRVFGQQGGPVVSTLLATLPYGYLNLIQMALGSYSGGPEKADFNNKENERKISTTISEW